MRPIFSSILLLTISIVLGLIVLEGAARLIVGVPWPERLPLMRVKADPHVGWVMIPKDIHYTYDKQIKLNSHGFRGPEINEKLKDEYRIIALGDSHIYGQGLDDESLATTVLGQRLNTQGQDCYFNVINLGVRAYSINNELAVLRKFGVSLRPDHVIVFFYINDFHEVNIERRYSRFSDKDWYMFDFSDKPNPNILREWKWRQFFRQSAFIMWAHDLYLGLSNSDNLENKILAGLVDEEFKEANQFVEDSLSELVELSKEYKFSVTLAVIPVAAQITNDYPNKNYQSTLKQIAQENSLDFVDFLPLFSSYHEISSKLPVIPFDGHYDSEGHGVIGSGMAEHFLNLAIGCKN